MNACGHPNAMQLVLGVLLAGNAGVVAQVPSSRSEDSQPLEQIVIVAPYGTTTVERDRVPSYVQSAGRNRSSRAIP